MNFEQMTQTELAAELEKKFKAYHYPFPYADCFKLQAEHGSLFEDFIPDFDLYSSEVCGCASSTNRFFTMSEEKARSFQKYVERPFFEIHPKYKAAEEFITPENTLHLFEQMQVVEQMRTGMRLLLMRRLASEE